MNDAELTKERQQHVELTYTVTFTELEYVAVLKAVLAADVAGHAGVHLAAKDALVRAKYERSGAAS